MYMYSCFTPTSPAVCVCVFVCVLYSRFPPLPSLLCTFIFVQFLHTNTHFCTRTHTHTLTQTHTHTSTLSLSLPPSPSPSHLPPSLSNVSENKNIKTLQDVVQEGEYKDQKIIKMKPPQTVSQTTTKPPSIYPPQKSPPL